MILKKFTKPVSDYKIKGIFNRSDSCSGKLCYYVHEVDHILFANDWALICDTGSLNIELVVLTC